MLNPALLQPLLTGLSRALARGSQDPAATAALLESLRPETPMQAMLAAQAIALHHAAMDCFGRAAQAPEEDGAAISRLQRNAASLTRAFTATLRTLQRCQAEAAREEAMQREAGWGRDGESGTWGGFGDQPTPPPVPCPQAEEESIPSPAAHLRHSPSHPSDPHAWSTQQDPMQREEPAQRPWEELTEAEQFAILYPDRVAAGATSHEDAHLWLGKLTRQPQPPAAAR